MNTASRDATRNIMKPTLAIFTTLLSIVALLAMMANVLATKAFTDSPPTGDRAMGLVVLFFAAVIGAVAIIVAAILCASAGGLGWLASSRGVALAIGATFTILTPAGIVLALIGWCEWRSGWAKPIAMLSGIVAPIVFVIVVTLCAWKGEPPVLWPLALLLLSVGSVCTLTIGGRLTYQYVDSSLEQQRRVAQAREEELAEERRRDAQTPLERAREDYGKYADDAPLWSVACGLVSERDPAARAFIIERSFRVPDFAARLAELATTDHAVFRQASLELMADAPADKVASEWPDLVARSIEVSAKEKAENPAWSTTPTTSNPYPKDHERAIEAAAARYANHPAVAAALKRFRGATATIP